MPCSCDNLKPNLHSQKSQATAASASMDGCNESRKEKVQYSNSFGIKVSFHYESPRPQLQLYETVLNTVFQCIVTKYTNQTLNKIISLEA